MQVVNSRIVAHGGVIHLALDIFWSALIFIIFQTVFAYSEIFLERKAVRRLIVFRIIVCIACLISAVPNTVGFVISSQHSWSILQIFWHITCFRSPIFFLQKVVSSGRVEF